MNIISIFCVAENQLKNLLAVMNYAIPLYMTKTMKETFYRNIYNIYYFETIIFIFNFIFWFFFK